MGLIQLHGLLPKSAQAQSSGPAHSLIPCGAVTALVSPFPGVKTFENLAPDEVAAWAMHHHRVLLPYCAEVAVLPMAVGAVFSSKAALKSEVAAEIDQHIRSLAALEHVKEFTVQLNLIAQPTIIASQPASGQEFLQGRRNRRDRRQQLHETQRGMANDILQTLKTNALQVTAAGLAKPDKLLNCAILLQDAKLANLQQMVRRLDSPAKANGLELVVTGPWPPYSFVPETALRQEACDAV